jgi:GIY-YIG catalytic domain
MNPDFARFVETLHPSLERLIAMKPIVGGVFPPNMPLQGVYLFSEAHRHLYVGRSNNLPQRYRQHSNPGSQHNQAVFAFKIAREVTGKTTRSYSRGPENRRGLISDPDFSLAFTEGKARVRRMEYRFVEEPDQTRQALLELYCAIALRCSYNDFNTS